MVRYARDVVYMDEGSCCNQPHCLMAVFVFACSYMSGDLSGGLYI